MARQGTDVTNDPGRHVHQGYQVGYGKAAALALRSRPKCRASSDVSGMEKPEPSTSQTRIPCHRPCEPSTNLLVRSSSRSCQTASGSRLRAAQNADALTNEPHKCERCVSAVLPWST